MKNKLAKLSSEISQCTICSEHLPCGPKPIFQISSRAKILVAGQAPGKKAHLSGIPFDDPSGDRLRDWMGINKDDFYNSQKVAILPMAFCYPGTGTTGDIAPRPECAETWRETTLTELKAVKLILCIGKYAHSYHLGKSQKSTLTKTVEAWREYQPLILPLPHPSPRNNRWLKKNEWFGQEVLPVLKDRVKLLLDN